MPQAKSLHPLENPPQQVYDMKFEKWHHLALFGTIFRRKSSSLDCRKFLDFRLFAGNQGV
jgi:hypothetical protein